MKNRYLTWEGVWLLIVLGFFAHVMVASNDSLGWWRGVAGYITIFVVPVLSGVGYGVSIRKVD